MNRWLPLLILLAIYIGVSGCTRESLHNKESPLAPTEEISEQMTLSNFKPVVNAFYVNGRGKGSSYESLRKNVDSVNEVSPLWYYICGDGSLEEEVDEDGLLLAKENGVKIFTLVALNYNRSSVVLLDEEAKERAVKNIVRVLERNGYDGINIDIEIIKAKASQNDYIAEKEGLTDFIARLKLALQPMGKRLDVCIVPVDNPPSDVALIYDNKKLFQTADRIVLMMYDYCRVGTLPGPVAPLPWVEENVKQVLAEGLPPEKLSLGVANYGRDWPAGSSKGKDISTWEALQRASEVGVGLQWDERWQTPYFKYTNSGGMQREVWFENGAAVKKKIDLVGKYHLAGFSVWRLGFEDADFWQAVKNTSL